MMVTRAARPEAGFTYRLQDVVAAPWFQRAVLVLIVIASVLVGLETYPEIMARHGQVILVLDWIVIALFGVEALVKMAQHGRSWYRYFGDPWNVFDFGVLVVCLLPVGGHFAAVLRLLRVLRALRLVTALPRLQLLVSALLKSVPSMGYVGLLLLLLFYVYGVMGVAVFRDNDPVHFGNLELSLLTLFRVVTLEDWTDVMYIQMFGSDVYPIDNPAAVPLQPRAQPVVGALYFVSFVLLGTMIMLNLFIGVIVGSMQEAQTEAERRAVGASGQPARRETARRERRDAKGGPDGAPASHHENGDDRQAIAAELDRLARRLDALRARL